MKSLFEELQSIDINQNKDKALVIESRVEQLIANIDNVIRLIETTYEPEVAESLKRKLFNSVKLRDPLKFKKGIRAMKTKKSRLKSLTTRKCNRGI